MLTDDKALARLPKYAQDHILDLRREVSDLKKSLDAASNVHPDSNVVMRGKNHNDPDIGLRPDSTIFFYAGEDRSRLSNMIEVHHDHDDPSRIRIASYGTRGLRIITASSNAFYLELEER
jgi:hypothetical protein